MSRRDDLPVRENPFCSRRIRPGALPFLFATGGGMAELLTRLEENGWWGQITGPHGHGKSAILAALVSAIEPTGRSTGLWELHDGQRRLPDGWQQGVMASDNKERLCIVDGYEQLGRWGRFRLKRLCRSRRCGLVVTAHAPVGLPDLFKAASNVELAQLIVRQLQDGFPDLVTPRDVAESFEQHAGDLREMLFDLYDRYERRR